MLRFTGKHIIITGAASGIGKAAAILFAAEGGKVLAADRNPGIHDVASQIVAKGGDAIALEMDAGSESDVSDMILKAIDSFGGIDVVFANAGIAGVHGTETGSVLEASSENWADVLRINLIGPAMAIKYAAPHMVQQGHGSIICTASVAGFRSGAGPTPYSASKAGVINLVQLSAQQLANSGVRVNAICPGLIETGITQSAFDHARRVGAINKIGMLNPLRRGGQPEEIAAVAAFLASDEASYINGQAIAVDGGLSSSLPFTRPPEVGKVRW